MKHLNPLLRQRSASVGEVTAETLGLIDDMFETIYAAQGRGLAAVQVGVLQRAVVLDVSCKGGAAAPTVLVDPKIVWCSEVGAKREERCLSIPGVPRSVTRPDGVRVRYRDRHGTVREEAFDEVTATAIQHEVDHLDGVLIIDRVP